MFLFFDTETTGYVLNRLEPDHPQQCHLVELGAILCDERGVERATLSMIIRPDGWVIPPAVAAIHGITQEIALRFGVEVHVAMSAFVHMMDNAERCLAYNMKFDRDVISLELIRLGEARPVEWPPEIESICVMEMARDALQLAPTVAMRRAGRLGPKTPSLAEAHMKLFDAPLLGAHSALVDARAAMRVWFKLTGRGEPGRDDTHGLRRSA